MLLCVLKACVSLLVPQEAHPSRFRFEQVIYLEDNPGKLRVGGVREGCGQLEGVVKQVVTAGNCRFILLGGGGTSVWILPLEISLLKLESATCPPT